MPYPLSQVIQGPGRLVCAPNDMLVRDALKLMIEHDFSQLPVVDASGKLLGTISEQDIVRTQYHANRVNVLGELKVDQCRARAVTLTPENDLFDALDRLEYANAVVIVENDKPVGIVTSYDTTHFFRDLSEGLIWAQDIEVTLRQYIERAFPNEQAMQSALMRAFGPDRQDGRKPAREYRRLTLGEHVTLITTEENWPKFGGVFEPKPLFIELMGQARDIRNNIAHLRGRAGRAELDALTRAFNWLTNRPKLPAPNEPKVEHVDVNRVRDAVASNSQGRRSKYAPLGDWLASIDPKKFRIRVGFHDIEEIIGQPLPPSSAHPSWWANDRYGHRQSIIWLAAGWRVYGFDLRAQQVDFERTTLGSLEEAFEEEDLA